MRDSINKALQWSLIPALLVYVASLSLSGLAGIKGQLVLRDLAQTCGTPAGVGLLSNLGYLLWLAAGAVALFTAYSGQPGVRGKQRELFLLAVALLGASIGIDQFQRDFPFRYETVQLVEEGAKFLGIATWVLYWWQASAQSLNKAQSRISS